MSHDRFVDGHGRIIGSVRISITDRCNLRCKYCMPDEGIEWQKKDKILTFEEILYLAKIFYNHGVRNFRITGGEPTVREDLVVLIKLLKDNLPGIELSMTTNGIKLKNFAVPLKNAGLDRLNISLDILDHHKFMEVTRRDQYNNVIEGIQAAIDTGITNIKLNAVSIKNFNDNYESLKEFIDFSEKNNIEVRFIEYMPFTGMNWKDGGFISSEELRNNIRKFEQLTPLEMIDEAATSKSWTARSGKATIGFVSSVSESFCNNCNRVRITAEGNFRPCLHNHREYPLRDLLRKGTDKNEIISVIRTALAEKWKEHPNFLAPSYVPPIDDREMIRIGG